MTDQVERPATKAIELPDDDARLAREAASRVVELQRKLGEETERFEVVKAGLLRALAEARTRYENLEDTLRQKHVDVPGRFDLIPELGAFVGQPTPAPGNGDARKTT